MLKKVVIYIFIAVLSVSFTNGSFSFAEGEERDVVKKDKDLEQAIWEYKHENYEEAYALLKTLRKKDPQSSLVAYYLGITCKQLQNFGEARPNLEAAVTLRPRVKNALMELIDLLYKKGDIEEAKKWIAGGEKEKIKQ